MISCLIKHVKYRIAYTKFSKHQTKLLRRFGWMFCVLKTWLMLKNRQKIMFSTGEIENWIEILKYILFCHRNIKKNKFSHLQQRYAQVLFTQNPKIFIKLKIIICECMKIVSIYIDDTMIHQHIFMSINCNIYIY